MSDQFLFFHFFRTVLLLFIFSKCQYFFVILNIMHNNLLAFYKEKLNDFIQAVINLFLFLPYFFCIPNLFKTLFAPWKNLISKQKTAGFSFDFWFSTLSFNLISRTIGFFMRSAIILFYFL